MKRTIIRYSTTVNQAKWQELCHLAALFRDEKNIHLRFYHHDMNYASCQNDRERRDQLVREGYKPITGLQARQWKTALKEAYETTHKSWCAMAETIRPIVAKQKNSWF